MLAHLAMATFSAAGRPASRCDGLVGGQPGRLHVGPDIGQHVLDRLEAANRLAELLALLRIGHGHFQHLPCATGSGSGLEGLRAVQGLIQAGLRHRAVAKPLFLWNKHIVETDLVHIGVGQGVQGDELDAFGLG